MPTVNTNSNHIVVHFFVSHSKHGSLGNQLLPKASASILYPHPIMSLISVTLTKAQLLERRTVLVNTPEVKHLPSDSCIINASALYSSEWHRQTIGALWTAVKPEKWIQVIKTGVAKWVEGQPPKDDEDNSDQVED
ncbi:hypothetical protein CROQUDRAFT_652614 [Cronartium quercuum f. sp. fusiforme G11]|uniref:Uncharacterized protein n=1 Tax=Cronartium quercuum f. sp. fusiforme G11 TaxID=708437 RepID=A0A9P6NTZ8_9BASI|nr:hypothetical protein CROQUDRAFT_652614 [Cronartium quercuum f. sp. fusiforme G11]